MAKVRPPEPGHVVEEFMLGNTRIRICDDSYRNQTPEELKKRMARIQEIAWKIVLNARAKGKDV